MWDIYRGTSLSALLRQLKTGANAPLLDDMVKPIYRLVLLQTLRTTPLAPPKCPRKLLREGLVFSEFAEDRLVRKVGNVLRIVEVRGCGGSLVRFLPIARLPRIDTYKNAKSMSILRYKGM